jgi:hypothetical protein
MNWTVAASSHKPSNPPSSILDIQDLTTFWQTDGNLPHQICLNLYREYCIASQLDIYFEYRTDESYCPSKIIFYAGEHPNMLIVSPIMMYNI